MSFAMKNSLVPDKFTFLIFLSPLCVEFPAAPMLLGTPGPGKRRDMPWLFWNEMYVPGQMGCESSCLAEYLTPEVCSLSPSWDVFMSLPSAQLLSLSQPCRTFTSLNFTPSSYSESCIGKG